MYPQDPYWTYDCSRANITKEWFSHKYFIIFFYFQLSDSLTMPKETDNNENFKLYEQHNTNQILNNGQAAYLHITGVLSPLATFCILLVNSSMMIKNDKYEI